MFSLIIPAFNEEKYLPRLLDSIKKQKMQPSEIIVADADSKDRTREIARKYGCRIVKGGRVSIGRNNGAKIAKEDIIIFMDADAIISGKIFFNKIIGTFIKRGADIASCFFLPAEKRGKYEIPMAGLSAFKFLFYKLKSNLIASGEFIICTKKLFKDLKGFDSKIRSREDNDFINRAFKSGKKYILIPTYLRVSTRRIEKKGMRKLLFIGGFSLLATIIGTSWIKKMRVKVDRKYWDDVK